MEDPAMMGMMGSSAPAPAPVAGGAPVEGAATTGHGFIITLTGTTPNGDAAQLLSETVIKSLEAMSRANLPKDKNYYVAKAEIVTTSPLRANSQRLTELQRLFVSAEQAKGLAAQQQQQQMIRPGGMMEDPAMMQEEMGGMIGGLGTGQPRLGPNGQPLEDTRPFRDRAMPNEDIRDDSEFSIVFAVVLDPTPVNPNAPVDPNAMPEDPAFPQ
jgi:hypothetical protein